MALTVLATAFLLACGTSTETPQPADTGQWKNCEAFNQTYPHGVGKKDAKDSTTDEPVTGFKVDDALYQQAIDANAGLDRDKDGIACEKG